MNVKRGSKNAIENRGKSAAIMCTTCGDEKKPYRVLKSGKKQMLYECKCGFSNKAGMTV